MEVSGTIENGPTLGMECPFLQLADKLLFVAIAAKCTKKRVWLMKCKDRLRGPDV